MINFYVILITILVFLFINIIVWNTVHAFAHHFDSSIICYPIGISNKYISEKNIIVKWLVNNHRKHHNNKNTNYNIVFPGADYIMNTYS